MRRAVAVLPLLLLIHAHEAFAAAGGGSSGFGGGGGGGGGGGFSGGGGGGTGAGGAGGAVMILLVVLAVLVLLAVGLLRERRRRRRRDARAVEARAAALEASEDDAAFDPDHVAEEAERIFRAVQDAWSENDRARLATLCGADLLVEWERRLDDFARKGWRNVVTIEGRPEVHQVGVVNREDDDEDRVVVLVEARLTDVVVDRDGRTIKRNDSSSATVHLREYWTLAKRDGRWTLRSIEQLGEGDHHLESPLVASHWSDDRVRDEAVIESAVAEAAPDGTDVAGLVDLDFAGDGERAALDLSLVDGRFAPQVLETSARRAVSAWAEAVDGEDEPLLEVARPEAVAALLYPRGGDTVRRVVRGPRVERMTLVSLDAESDPPRMLVELALGGRRYLEDRDTAAVLEGSREGVARWTERWTFVLDGTDDTPWVVGAATDAPVPG